MKSQDGKSLKERRVRNARLDRRGAERELDTSIPENVNACPIKSDQVAAIDGRELRAVATRRPYGESLRSR
jgi:hypothetical protein